MYVTLTQSHPYLAAIRDETFLRHSRSQVCHATLLTAAKETLGKQDEVAFNIGTGCLINTGPSVMIKPDYCFADTLVLKIDYQS